MAIYVKDSLNTTDIRVKDCYAYDNSKNAKNGLKPAQLQLSQSNGCPIREQLLGVWQRTQETMETGATMIAYTLLRAFKFPETDSVFLACNVDLCKDRCTDRCPLETQNRNDHQSSPPLDYEATIEDHSPPSMDYENSPAPYQPAQSSKAKSIKTASADYYSNEASPDESNSNELTSPDDNHPIKRQPSRDYVNHGLTEFQGADQSPENRKMKSKNVEIIVNHKKFPSTKSNGVDEVEPIDQNRIADQLYSLSQPIDTLLNSDPETANVESNTKEPDSQLNSLDESNRRARRLWFQKWPNFRNKVKTSSMMVRMNADIRLTNHQKTKAIAQLSGLTRPNLKIPSSSTPERKKRYT